MRGIAKTIESRDINGTPYRAWINGLVSWDMDLAKQLTQGSSFDQLFPAMLDSILKRNNQRELE